jgi:hypothetical protein
VIGGGDDAEKREAVLSRSLAAGVCYPTVSYFRWSGAPARVAPAVVKRKRGPEVKTMAVAK